MNLYQLTDTLIEYQNLTFSSNLHNSYVSIRIWKAQLFIWKKEKKSYR